MSEIDKTARELLAAEYLAEGRTVTAQETMNGHDLQTHAEYIVLRATRTALLTAPPGWKLVPITPTDDMIDAAEDAHMPFGDMHFAITSAILSAPEPK